MGLSQLAVLPALLGALLCASARAQSPFSADLGLIKQLGPDAYRDELLDAPYLAVFERGKKLLVFVSADHTDGVDSAVARTVRKALKRYKPRAVVVEGLTAESPEDQREWLAQAQRFADGSPQSFPENYYPAYLAHQRGIPFAGGEPALRDSLAALKPLGFSAEDLLGFIAARNVAAQNDKAPREAADFAKHLDGWLMEQAGKLGLNKGFRYADFELWYKRRAALGKPAHQLIGEDVRSEGRPGPNFLQTLHYHHTLTRERSIVREIALMLERHDRVLVVYGSGHLVSQREVWKRALGPSKDSKPF